MLRRKDQEQEDLIWRIHQETMEEEAKEEPAETLERCPKNPDWEQRGEELASIVVMEPQEREEQVGRPNEVTIVQPEPEIEQLTPQGLSPHQQEWQPEPPLNKEKQRTPRDRGEQELRLEPVQQFDALTQHGTCR